MFDDAGWAILNSIFADANLPLDAHMHKIATFAETIAAPDRVISDGEAREAIARLGGLMVVMCNKIEAQGTEIAALKGAATREG